MASSNSSPFPRGAPDGIYLKEQDPAPPRRRPVRSLPDVCPKEPTGGRGFLPSLMMSSEASRAVSHVH